uniref:Cytochrome c biogenesis protein CcsA n=1 Tax=Juniperus seravschanica TaxID=993107 RepID=UPI001E7ABD35|nr:Cytochrome c biogenesis protein CcsA [Juniperus seravschanica]YP_010426886.1 cytochrome c heme attachment protein [Juniperus gaussenii]YP_010427050.1 cytochrome c heme attachment protein [Juniperus procumbens]QZI85452.1 cytochrome c biogenesis protein [Juniperus chinensis]UNB14503.1 cytochrome c heme attachment protein [Juniperus seravschanica]USN89726.1 cytochrome c heme attachment protein [Juniperus gaussenii]USN89890.1 cytochrome c heme attachment protein [Juniperus procumbens]WAL05780
MIFITLEHISAHVSFSLTFVITLIYWGTLIYRSEKLSNSGGKGMIVTCICITGVLISRSLYSGHLPLSNLYESFMFLSWTSSMIHIVIQLRGQYAWWLGAITAPSAMLTHGFATLGLPDKMQESAMLVPALQSHWLMMHVSMILLSYATLLCGSLSSISLLVIASQINQKILNQKIFLNVKNSFFFNWYSRDQEKKELKQTFYLSLRNYRKWVFTNQLDQFSYRTIGLGFSLLTIGILSGAVWANEAWGSYWSWDPKETWALITWILFAIYLHTRINRGWKGQKPAIVASLGFILVWTCYLGVDLLGIGLHSYGWLL